LAADWPRRSLADHVERCRIELDSGPLRILGRQRNDIGAGVDDKLREFAVDLCVGVEMAAARAFELGVFGCSDGVVTRCALPSDDGELGMAKPIRRPTAITVRNSFSIDSD
jgi:hypothetical protein